MAGKRSANSTTSASTLYRAEAADGPWTRLNPHLIPSSAPGSAPGQMYEWLDAGADIGGIEAGRTYWYRLEAVDVHGQAQVAGVVSIEPEQPSSQMRLWLPAMRHD